MAHHLLKIKTSASLSFYLLTNQLQKLIVAENIYEGLVVGVGEHTTTALIVNEMDETFLEDLKILLSELATFSNGL